MQFIETQSDILNMIAHTHQIALSYHSYLQFFKLTKVNKRLKSNLKMQAFNKDIDILSFALIDSKTALMTQVIHPFMYIIVYNFHTRKTLKTFSFNKYQHKQLQLKEKYKFAICGNDGFAVINVLNGKIYFEKSIQEDIGHCSNIIELNEDLIAAIYKQDLKQTLGVYNWKTKQQVYQLQTDVGNDLCKFENNLFIMATQSTKIFKIFQINQNEKMEEEKKEQLEEQKGNNVQQLQYLNIDNESHQNSQQNKNICQKYSILDISDEYLNKIKQNLNLQNDINLEHTWKVLKQAQNEIQDLKLDNKNMDQEESQSEQNQLDGYDFDDFESNLNINLETSEDKQRKKDYFQIESQEGQYEIFLQNRLKFQKENNQQPVDIELQKKLESIGQKLFENDSYLLNFKFNNYEKTQNQHTLQQFRPTFSVNSQSLTSRVGKNKVNIVQIQNKQSHSVQEFEYQQAERQMNSKFFKILAEFNLEIQQKSINQSYGGLILGFVPYYSLPLFIEKLMKLSRYQVKQTPFQKILKDEIFSISLTNVLFGNIKFDYQKYMQAYYQEDNEIKKEQLEYLPSIEKYYSNHFEYLEKNKNLQKERFMQWIRHYLNDQHQDYIQRLYEEINDEISLKN
ncbi:WD40-repeat-containing domain [Pseudocohnilembus persalinus]|uniref:WD40-repeat-containing domain n=1 Tax=Pseudocohnilembus persalinus TaxID=266149 RepID=A0A0V0QMV0_PSEPJ|nr:WD40-repeat-containing domain [Pseudocohnilembus persalinus]|eukprot:KRX03556.1 WD40-repeat-containing domain [Pseudocohnilembus persalinus]